VNAGQYAHLLNRLSLPEKFNSLPAALYEIHLLPLANE